MSRRRIVLFLGVLTILGIGIFAGRDSLYRMFFRPTSSSVEEGVRKAVGDDEVSTFAQELTVPWEIAFTSGGDALVTERPGTLRRIGNATQSIPIEGVAHVGEGGLLGLTLHPDFPSNSFLYLYLTTRTEGGLTNRVERYTYNDDKLNNRVVIMEKIPGAATHDGGRIAFGPDDKLYISTGDAGSPESAQDVNTLNGKILRLNDDGTIPNDNPFKNTTYAYGFRNVQGMAWDDDERLWVTDHGPSGSQSGFDELNLVRAGGNYGWPTISGDEQREGMLTPVAHSGRSDTWAPAGMAFYNGSLFFAGLRGNSLYEAIIQTDDSVEMKSHFRSEFGRLRAVSFYNGSLYVSTSNKDGRGSSRENDDKIIRINAKIFDD